MFTVSHTVKTTWWQQADLPPPQKTTSSKPSLAQRAQIDFHVGIKAVISLSLQGQTWSRWLQRTPRIKHTVRYYKQQITSSSTQPGEQVFV